ncbi:NAD(P)-dependent alcohol dehydrogenase [Pseudofrankia sp. DC12]|uniref:NAD(P)-dependent alcohol dehydrogenase n=1 Tax=Pseudofrankia sp. DC12 TaxID=683315 RepID=UPI0005F83901|nr:NAD(P)-dependent alcohol dehydrogenase [Pseudofrankia sp. DC12]
MKATAAVFPATGAPVAFHEVEVAEPRDSEVLVRMTATGICHTDLSVRDGIIPFPLPAVAGHEGAGVVEAAGRAVRTVEPGDKVLLVPPSCGVCGPCGTGHPSLCEVSALRWSGRRLDGTPVLALDGAPLAARFLGQSSFCSHALVEERTVLRAPRDVADTTLAPFGCGVVTGAGAVLRVLRPGPGSSVVVLGAGAVGLSAVMAAAVTAATRIVAVDLVPSRLELARELGATGTINGREAGDLGAAIRELTGGGADFVVETTASTQVLRAALSGLARGGTVGLVGAAAPTEQLALPLVQLVSGAMGLRGVVMGDGSPAFLRALIGLHRQGRLPVDRLVQVYPFERIDAAMADAAGGRTIKPVLTFG